MINDTVKIAIIVASPILFFTLLFLSAYLYRRHRTPFRRGSFKSQRQSTALPTSPKGAVWDPSKRERRFPHCHICWEDHRVNTTTNNQREVPLTDSTDSQNTLVNSSTNIIRTTRYGNTLKSCCPAPSMDVNVNEHMLKVTQPHFEEKQLSIRRISSNPLAPDEYTRVNSFCSSLNNANPSSDLLPYGGGKRTSHISSANGFVADALAPGVIPFGQVSSFLSIGNDEDRMSIRRVSIGGKEDTLNISGLNPTSQERLDLSGIPIRRSFTENQRNSRSPSDLPKITTFAHSPLPDFNSQGTVEDLPSPHPFSAASLRRSSFISQPPLQFPVPHIKVPEKVKTRRPESLNIPAYTVLSPSQITTLSGTTYMGKSNSLSIPVQSASSTKAIKSSYTPGSGPVPQSSIDTCSSFGYDPIDAPQPRKGYFEEGWNGFALGSSSGNGGLIPKIEVPISPTTPTHTKSVSPIRFDQPNHSHQSGERGAQMHDHCGHSNNHQKTSEGTAPPSAHERTSSNLTISSPTQTNHKRTPSEASKITYLSDLVREKEDDNKRQSVNSTSAELYPPNEVLVGKRTSIVGSEKTRPVSQTGGALATGMGVGMVFGMSQGEVGR
ncbi:hypothetical protein I302_108285 [Kwoniella bestiolae CBS 10118]|uniref:Uncharacterized protein n=1 Tax=Kwoniella bestiolae CBS 10118 TaxID=1296100 RepID=A0A1B9FW48_9TREE|nr:hypothetical protein I302_07347 [Kwoniella bestiolae CBS 10118]OCF22997.1 hypothetical protein I302_07347 [Kwoniella bestiolae CBS 10118]